MFRVAETISGWLNSLGLDRAKVIYTIGYSSRGFDEFVDLLRKHDVDVLIDVRRYPYSRLEWFSRDGLNRLLSYGIKYYSFPELGALGIAKHVKPIHDINCTSSPTYRSYITYILTDLNAKLRIKEVISMVDSCLSVCLMCCEKFPWRCHRRFLSDYLKALKYDVIHIIDDDKIIMHRGTGCYSYIRDRISSPQM
jgi:uncharacterized protein (DUF488 family)